LRTFSELAESALVWSQRSRTLWRFGLDVLGKGFVALVADGLSDLGLVPFANDAPFLQLLLELVIPPFDLTD